MDAITELWFHQTCHPSLRGVKDRSRACFLHCCRGAGLEAGLISTIFTLKRRSRLELLLPMTRITDSHCDHCIINGPRNGTKTQHSKDCTTCYFCLRWQSELKWHEITPLEQATEHHMHNTYNQHIHPNGILKLLLIKRHHCTHHKKIIIIINEHPATAMAQQMSTQNNGSDAVFWTIIWNSYEQQTYNLK